MSIVENLYKNVKTTETRDDYQTPEEIIYPILDFIYKNKIIWECTGTKNSNITKILKSNGFNVIETHIDEGFNFLTNKPNFNFDIIITNSPFSLKTEFITRCYEIGKPFMLLLPVTALEGTARQKLYAQYGIKLLLFNRRVNFIRKELKTGCWFGSAWFCWNIDKIKQQLNFLNIIKTKIKN
jgi:hypothetical protein